MPASASPWSRDGNEIDVSAWQVGHWYVDAPPHVAEFRESVVLQRGSAAAGGLPKPSANPAAVRHGAAVGFGGQLGKKLRRASNPTSGYH